MPGHHDVCRFHRTVTHVVRPLHALHSNSRRKVQLRRSCRNGDEGWSGAGSFGGHGVGQRADPARREWVSFGAQRLCQSRFLYWGLRRGELVGLERADLSVNTRRMHVRQAQADDELDDTKTENGDRQIVFDEETAKILLACRKQQLEERVGWGEAYTDSGRVFTYEDGRSLRPAYVSQRFALLIERYAAIRRRHAEAWPVERIARRHRVPVDAVHIALTMPLPPIRFHDLRHGVATMLIAAGPPMKLVSDVLGHASVAFTSDVYAVVAEELAEQAAAAISAFVPRRQRSTAVGAINVPAEVNR